MFFGLADSLNISAEKFPDNIAVSSKTSSLTYAGLAQGSDAIASYLVATGLKKGDRVALLVENSVEYVVSYYGILKAGGVVVALNTAAKSTDLLNWIRHSGATWLVAASAHPELSELVAALKNTVHYILVGANSGNMFEANVAQYDAIIADRHRDTHVPVLKENDTAAIIYTSGTTGQPKGVTLSHGNMTANMASILAYLPIEPTDKCLNVLPFYYSFGNSVLHTHLIKGASVFLENSFLFPHQIVKRIQDEKISSFYGVPSTYALLLNRTKLDEFDLGSVRYLAQAGGAMMPEHIKRIREKFSRARFYVMYGQTEASARLSYLPPEWLDRKMSSIGHAIPGVTLEVRNKEGVKTAPEETGEIYASGNNIMQGYWNDPALTSTVLNNGWLKTGDLAKQDAEGFIYIVGRESEMIKSGAHRISPLDIEEVILRYPGIAEVAVIGVPDEILGQVILACLVPRQDIVLEKRDVLAHCKQHLASYKIPKHIQFVDELPKTPSGKIKRFELQKLANIQQ
jgi:acyl-CoA synthetase (AMP-forming)/AMP-acid ligase II